MFPLPITDTVTVRMLINEAKVGCSQADMKQQSSSFTGLGRGGSGMNIRSIHLGVKINTGFEVQWTFLTGKNKNKKEDSHELIVPANALWDIGFCDTDRLWISGSDKQWQKMKGSTLQRRQQYYKKHGFKRSFSPAGVRQKMKACGKGALGQRQSCSKTLWTVKLLVSQRELQLLCQLCQDIYEKLKSTLSKPSREFNTYECNVSLRVDSIRRKNTQAAFNVSHNIVLNESFLKKGCLVGINPAGEGLHRGSESQNKAAKWGGEKVCYQGLCTSLCWHYYLELQCPGSVPESSLSLSFFNVVCRTFKHRVRLDEMRLQIRKWTLD